MGLSNCGQSRLSGQTASTSVVKDHPHPPHRFSTQQPSGNQTFRCIFDTWDTVPH